MVWVAETAQHPLKHAEVSMESKMTVRKVANVVKGGSRKRKLQDSKSRSARMRAARQGRFTSSTVNPPPKIGVRKGGYISTKIVKATINSDYIPIRVYSKKLDQKFVAEITDGLISLMTSLDMIVKDEEEPVYKSFLKKWTFKTKEFFSNAEVQKRLEKAERAIELATLNKYQADIDEKIVNAAASIIKSLENVDESVIQIGSFVIVKTNNQSKSRIMIKQLTQTQLMMLEKNQDLIEKPSDFFELLKRKEKLYLKANQKKASE